MSTAAMLGKRKRRAPEASEHTGDAHAEPRRQKDDAQAVFRDYFERQFQPIELDEDSEPTSEDEFDASNDDGESEWSGISEEEDGTSRIYARRLSKGS
jgi:hypothetical protein